MKKFVLVFCVILLPAIFFAQEKDSTGVEPERISAELEIGQDLLIGQTIVEFLEVLSDSRCPRQVTCIWPGEAKVLLGIARNGKYFEKEVVVSGQLLLAEDFLIKLYHLRPYPETAMKIAPKEYCLSFSARFPAEG